MYKQLLPGPSGGVRLSEQQHDDLQGCCCVLYSRGRGGTGPGPLAERALLECDAGKLAYLRALGEHHMVVPQVPAPWCLVSGLSWCLVDQTPPVQGFQNPDPESSLSWRRGKCHGLWPSGPPCTDSQVKTRCHQLTPKEKSFGKELQAVTQKVSLKGNPEASESQQAYRTEAGAEHSWKKITLMGRRKFFSQKKGSRQMSSTPQNQHSRERAGI